MPAACSHLRLHPPHCGIYGDACAPGETQASELGLCQPTHRLAVPEPLCMANPCRDTQCQHHWLPGEWDLGQPIGSRTNLAAPGRFPQTWPYQRGLEWREEREEGNSSSNTEIKSSNTRIHSCLNILVNKAWSKTSFQSQKCKAIISVWWNKLWL